MSANAIDFGLNGSEAGPDQSGPCETKDGNARPELSRHLMRYWRDELTRPLAMRRLALEAARSRARHTSSNVAILPFALGDVDEGIVFRATIAYVSECGRDGGSLPLRASNAADWIRRRLALNCAAVFAALLSTDDDRVHGLLLPLRQMLDADEVASVQRRHGHVIGASTRAFLEEWRRLATA